MPLTSEQKRKVKDLYQQKGMGRRAIASELDLSERMVRDFLETLEDEEITVEPLRIYVWDLETTDFKSDIGTIRVASFLNINNHTFMTRTHQDFESETEFVKWILERMEEADVLIGHNSVSFDKPFVTGVAGRLGLAKPAKRIHWDTYLIARYGWKGNISYSLENLADHLGLPLAKYRPPKSEWREMIIDKHAELDAIVERCESDVKITAMVFDRLRPYLFEWKGQT